MKRKIDWDEEKESGQEDNTSSYEENASGEPRISDVLNNLSQTVSRKYASDLLHCMAASCFGHLVDNYSEISAEFQSQTSRNWSDMCYSLITQM